MGGRGPRFTMRVSAGFSPVNCPELSFSLLPPSQTFRVFVQRAGREWGGDAQTANGRGTRGRRLACVQAVAAW